MGNSGMCQTSKAERNAMLLNLWFCPFVLFLVWFCVAFLSGFVICTCVLVPDWLIFRCCFLI